MNGLWRQVRNYVFVPSGEAIRGLEVTVGTAVVEALYKVDATKLLDPSSWLHGVLLASVIAALAYGKGKLPPKTSV